MKTKIRLIREFEWIKKLQTPFPLGFNDNMLQHGNISRNTGFDVFSIFQTRKRKTRSHGIRKNRNIKRRSKTKISLNGLSSILNNSGTHTALSKISSLAISSLCSLQKEADNYVIRNHPLYEAAALVDCYCRHYLKPHIDKDSEHKRYFLKIDFINKGIDFIDLPSILKDKTVTSKVPVYFSNKETPMICYKYNKPIRNLIFNYNNVVSDKDILSNSPCSCDCANSEFCYSPTGHIITGNLEVISNKMLQDIISKGPKFRLPNVIEFDKCFSVIKDSLEEFCVKWCKRENTSSDALVTWKAQILSIVEKRILFYQSNPNLLPPKFRYSLNKLKRDIKDVHNKFVLVPADKAANNVVVI